MAENRIQFSNQPTRTVSPRFLIGLGILILAAAILSILFFDQLVTQMVTTKKHVSLYRPVRFLTEIGEGKYYFAFVLVVGIFSLGWVEYLKRFKNKNHDFFARIAKWSGFAFLCMLSSGIVLQVLKHVIGRQRPHVSVDVDPHVFDFFTMKWHYHSMPSGHTQTVFTFATILWITFPKLTKWIFIIPALLAFTRLPLEEHFFSDVFVGAYIGFIMTIVVGARLNRITVKS